MDSTIKAKLSALIDRRALLHAMGLGAGSLFLPSLIGDRAAHAAGAPKRVWIFYTQHGPHYPSWKMRPAGMADTNQDWEVPLATLPASVWSHSLAPLQAIKDDVLIVDGCANTVGVVNDPGRNNAHDIGNGTMLTGAFITDGAGDNRGGGPSIDQIIAKAVAVEGRRQTLYATTWGSWTPVFSGPSKPLSGINEPRPLFDSIAGLAGGGASTGGMPDKMAVARASLPDLVREDYKSVIGKLGGEDKRKLEDHVALIDALQKQLQTSTSGSLSGCSLGQQPGGVAMHAENAMASARVLTAALSCDITRVVVQVHGQMGTSEFGAPDVKDVHQDIAHQATNGRPEAMYMASYYRKHAEQFAQIAMGLKAVKEGNGTLLDSTALVWVTELANGPHELHRIPLVIAGSCGGYFKTGRYAKYAETTPNPKGGTPLGPAHNKFLVSIMRAMGLPNDSIGLGEAGGVNLKGTLPRLAVTG